jgi:hypothetical protein
MAWAGVTLAKPGTVGDIAVAADTLGRTSSDHFILKIKEVIMDFSTVLADVTGDGDVNDDASPLPVVRVEHNELLGGQGLVRGFLLSSVLATDGTNSWFVGIRNLINADRNPLQTTPGTIDPLTLNFHTTDRTIAFGCLVESIRIAWGKDDPFVLTELGVHVSNSEPVDA